MESASLTVSRITVNSSGQSEHHGDEQPVPTQTSVMSAAPFEASYWQGWFYILIVGCKCPKFLII